MLHQIRRVITGHDKNGKSVIVSDESSPNVLCLSEEPPMGLTDLWVTQATPADNSNFQDSAARKVVLLPPKGGSLFRVVEFAPESQLVGEFDRGAVFQAMSAHDTMDPDTSRHPMMHRTATVDYAIIISGEIYAILDEGETLLRAGDTLIQRGTNHAWSNRSDKPCLIAFVLVDANPV